MEEVSDRVVPAICSSRLDLVSMSREFIALLLDDRRDEARRLIGAEIPTGWPDDHDARFVRMRAEEMERRPEIREWLIRAAISQEGEERVMVGHVGFHGPPGRNGPGKPDALEVGYTIFAPFRGRGYATEVAEALMDWALQERGVRYFIASAAPQNKASVAVLRKLGFKQTGEQWDDEDGLELVFELTID
ncbi:MAG: GNAT family N-acetyltransferase [Actinobacteria bacterium]|nr:GNAT family N-acetyltransferase [Actinomycetota bacterium]